jgi:hypothetical protein
VDGSPRGWPRRVQNFSVGWFSLGIVFTWE